MVLGLSSSHDAVLPYIACYQVMLAARKDRRFLWEAYARGEEMFLSIDGLRPEKGHETLYVVRELTQKRIWFAGSLLSPVDELVQRLIVMDKEWAEQLGKRVLLWMSEKPDSFLTSIAAECPDVSDRYSAKHFLRDMGSP